MLRRRQTMIITQSATVNKFNIHDGKILSNLHFIKSVVLYNEDTCILFAPVSCSDNSEGTLN